MVSSVAIIAPRRDKSKSTIQIERSRGHASQILLFILLLLLIPQKFRGAPFDTKSSQGKTTTILEMRPESRRSAPLGNVDRLANLPKNVPGSDVPEG